MPIRQLPKEWELKYNWLMKINVKNVARLANLPVSLDEEKKFEKQLEETLTYIENLNEVDTTEVKPADNVTGLTNITREDIVEPSLSQEEALRNTKSTHRGFFKVKGILDAK